MKHKIAWAMPVILLVVSCSDTPKTEQAESPAQHGENQHIQLSTEQIKRANIAWGAVEMRNVSTRIPLTGELRIHPEHRATVSTIAGGFVAAMHVSLNKTVRKGELIATLHVPELLDIQQQFLETRDRLQFLQSEFERYRALKNDDATASKNFQKADAELRAAHTTTQVLSTKLRIYGIESEQLTPGNVRSELRVVAPMNGVVTAVHSSAGTAVQVGTPLCEVADFANLHADLFVFEKDILKIKNGQRAEISFPGLPDKTLGATVFSIDRVLDPMKNALRVHARLDNSAGLTLTDGAYLDAKLALDAPVKLHSLPSAAIVREGLEEFILVFEQETDGVATFRPVMVKTISTEHGFTSFEPEQPLPADTKVVLRGAYFVWSEGKVEEFAEEE